MFLLSFYLFISFLGALYRFRPRAPSLGEHTGWLSWSSKYEIRDVALICDASDCGGSEIARRESNDSCEKERRTPD